LAIELMIDGSFRERIVPPSLSSGIVVCAVLALHWRSRPFWGPPSQETDRPKVLLRTLPKGTRLSSIVW